MAPRRTVTSRCIPERASEVLGTWSVTATLQVLASPTWSLIGRYSQTWSVSTTHCHPHSADDRVDGFRDLDRVEPVGVDSEVADAMAGQALGLVHGPSGDLMEFPG